MLPVVWSQPNLLGFVEIDDIGISSKFCLNSDWHDDRVPYAWEQPNSFVCLLLQSFFWQCYIQNHLTMNRITDIQYLYSDCQYLYSDCQYLNSDIYASCGLISTKSFGLCGDRWHRHFKQILFELWLAWRPGTICLRTAQLLCLPAFAVFLLTVLYSKPFDNEPITDIQYLYSDCQYLYSDCQYLNSDIYASCGLISTKSFGLCGDRWHRHFKQILFELWLAWRPGTICLRTAQLLCLPAFAVFLLTVLYSKPFDNEPYHRHSIFIFRLSIFIFRLSIFKQWYLCFLWSDLNQIFWALWRSMT